jgi:hypothetical protein
MSDVWSSPTDVIEATITFPHTERVDREDVSSFLTFRRDLFCRIPFRCCTVSFRFRYVIG